METVASRLLFLEGINNELEVSHRVGVGLQQVGFETFHLGIDNLHLMTHQRPEVDLDTQLLEMEQPTVLLVFDIDTQKTDVLAEEIDANLIDADLGVQAFLEH